MDMVNRVLAKSTSHGTHAINVVLHGPIAELALPLVDVPRRLAA
jgi:hypothetical protein